VGLSLGVRLAVGLTVRVGVVVEVWLALKVGEMVRVRVGVNVGVMALAVALKMACSVSVEALTGFLGSLRLSREGLSSHRGKPAASQAGTDRRAISPKYLRILRDKFLAPGAGDTRESIFRKFSARPSSVTT
jgi:hypothetical protein